MSTGLKSELGLGEPKAPAQGSTQQADQFKAAFQAQMSQVNSCLQYTAAHAETSKQAPIAAKRDASRSAYQSALAQIDPTDPSKAQAAIDQVLSGVSSLAEAAKTFRDAVEKAFDAWTEREPEFDDISGKIREMVDWGFEQATSLTQVVDAITANVNCKKYEEALQTLLDLVSKITSIYEEFLRQKAAKEEYEAALAALESELGDAATCEYAALEAVQLEISDLAEQMRQTAESRDFVAALEQLNALKAKLEEYQASLLELDTKKQDYESGLAALQPRMDAASTSELASTGPAQEAMIQTESEMKAAAEAQDYENAIRLQADLESKLVEYEAIIDKRDEYLARLEALQPQLQEASVSDERFAYLQSIQSEMATLQTEMEAAAEAEDYDNALRLLGELEAKVGEFFAKIEEKKKEYQAAHDSAIDKLSSCLVTAMEYPAIKADRDALTPKKQEMEKTAAGEDYENAIKLAKELESACTKYLAKAEKEQKQYDEKGEKITKELDAAGYLDVDDVAREWVGKLSDEDLKHLPTSVRNRMMKEMQGGVQSDADDKAIQRMYEVRALDPEYEKEMKLTRGKFVELLRDDPELEEARKKWSSTSSDGKPLMSDEEKMKVLEKVAKIHAKTYGTENVEGAPELTLKPVDRKPTSNGSYNHSSGVMKINTNPTPASDGVPPKFQDFDRALDLVAHEAGHRHQNVLADRVRNGDIKPGDPLYEQAEAFRLNDDYYVTPSNDNVPYKVYKNQPMESASRISGAAVHDAGVGDGREHDHDH